jgi:hypothetical protein
MYTTMRRRYIDNPSEDFGKFKIITNRKNNQTFYVKIEEKEYEEEPESDDSDPSEEE